MSTQVQFRRGSTTAHGTFTGAAGEITVDEDKKVPVVHDGSTAGGFPAMRENGSQNLVTTGTTTAASFKPTSVTAPSVGLYSPGAGQVAISTGGTGRVFVDSAGKVGIGTNSPYARLQVLDSVKISNSDQSQGSLVLGDGSSTAFNVGIARWNGGTNAAGAGGIGYFSQGSSNVGGHYFYTGDAAAGSQTERLRITATGDVNIKGAGTAGSTQAVSFSGSAPINSMVLDASGNLGLGVTPSAWVNTFRALQVGASAALAAGPSNNVILYNNARFDGTNVRYINDGFASSIQQFNGAHNWYTASSGTAGNPITFTQAMTLDASGRLGVGVTSPSNTLDVNGTARFRLGGTNQLVVSTDSGNPYLYVEQNAPLNFGTNSQIRATLDSSGRLLVGATVTQVGAGGSDLLQVTGAVNLVASTNVYSRLVPTASGLEIIANAYPANIGTTQSVIIKSGTSGGGGPSEIARFTSDGNLGLGVTPSAWSGYKPLQAGSGASFGGYAGDVLSFMGSNAYNDNTNWRYILGGNAAARYQQSAGVHAWHTAPSGTAGNTTTITSGLSYTTVASGNQTAFGAPSNTIGTTWTATSSGTLSSGTVIQNITFTQAMTLDANGRLGVGPTSPTALLHIGQGTTANAPIKLTSGTNLSSPSAGAIEYDGNVFYSTPSATSGRGLSPSSLIYRLNSALVGNTGLTAQNALGVSVTVAASTIYLFEFYIFLNKTVGTTVHNVLFQPGGTATINNASYLSVIPSISGGGVTYTTNFAVWNSSFTYSSITNATVNLGWSGKGTVSINASGTLNLNYSLSVSPGGAYSTLPGSYFMLTPIGAAGSNTSIGSWA